MLIDLLTVVRKYTRCIYSNIWITESWQFYQKICYISFVRQ